MKQTRREFLKTAFAAVGALLFGNIGMPSMPRGLPEDGKLHHIVDVYDADGSITRYVDGEMVASGLFFEFDDRTTDAIDVGSASRLDDIPESIDGKWIVVGSCSHCGAHVNVDDAESCWYCQGDLCVDCWERIGHCGHAEAHIRNYEAAHVRQPGESLMTARNVYWSEDDWGWFWVADLYRDGVKVGGTGNYYDDIDDRTGLRYPREDQILMCPQYLCIHGQGDDCWRCGTEWAAYNYGKT